MAEPTLRVPPIPTPPETARAPVEVDVEAVEDRTDTIELVVSTFNMLVPPAFFTTKAAVLELLWV